MRERRRYPRQPQQRSAKVRRVREDRYLPAVTVDRSAGGALLQLIGPTTLHSGEPIELAVAESTSPLLHSRHMRPGRVVRCLGGQGGSIVAVAFDAPVSQSLAAAG